MVEYALRPNCAGFTLSPKWAENSEVEGARPSKAAEKRDAASSGSNPAMACGAGAASTTRASNRCEGFSPLAAVTTAHAAPSLFSSMAVASARTAPSRPRA